MGMDALCREVYLYVCEYVYMRFWFSTFSKGGLVGVWVCLSL